jgi:hypothetical protein
MLHQGDCVGSGSLGGAEARHRETVDQPAINAEHVAGRDRDQERERGIEAPGDADVQRPAGWELLDAFGQPCALDGQDLRAPAVKFRTRRGHERRARHRALQAVHAFGQCEGNAAKRCRERPGVIETAHDPAFGAQLGDITYAYQGSNQKLIGPEGAAEVRKELLA